MNKKIIDWWLDLNDKINRQMNAYLSGKPKSIDKTKFFDQLAKEKESQNQNTES